jgi:hypothetical protein
MYNLILKVFYPKCLGGYDITHYSDKIITLKLHLIFPQVLEDKRLNLS